MATPRELDALVGRHVGPAGPHSGKGPPKIVDITKQDSGRHSVLRLSDLSTMRVSTTAVVVAELRVGSEIDDAARLRIMNAEVVAKAVGRGLRMLKASAKAKGELRERLLAKDIDAGVVEKALRHIESHGLLDDGAIARSIAAKPDTSNELARQVMEGRKIDSQTIAEVLGSRGGDAARAVEVARGVLAGLPARAKDGEKRRKVLAALARKGFDEFVALEAADQVAPARESSDDEWTA